MANKGWKPNPKIQSIYEQEGSSAIGRFVKSPEFTEQDYVDLMAGQYDRDLYDPNYDRDVGLALKNSKYNKVTTNQKVIDNIYESINAGERQHEKEKLAEDNDPIRVMKDAILEHEPNQYGRYSAEQIKKLVGLDPKELGLEVEESYGEAKFVSRRNLQERKVSTEGYDSRNSTDNINRIASQFNLGSRTLTDLLTDEKYRVKHWREPEKVPVTDALDNPNIKPEHLYRFASQHPESAGLVVGHDLADDHLSDILFGDPDKIQTMPARAIESYLSDKFKNDNDNITTTLSPKRIKDLLEHAPNKVGSTQLDHLLSTADPEYKKDWTDRKLGIKGGSYENQDRGVHDEDEEYSWNNWKKGEEYDPKIAKWLSNPGLDRNQDAHLDEDQINHIKRHGSFQEKYDLYHNKSIDPKHGREMFKLWHDNEVDKGYDADELTAQYKEFKNDLITPDDLSPEIIEEIREDLEDNGTLRESAEESYSFSQWMSDNSGSLANQIEDSDMPSGFEDKVQEAMDEHDWEGPNPESQQNLGNPNFQKLNTLYEDYKDDSHITSDEFQETTGLKDPKELELEADEDGNIDLDHLKEALGKYGGPETINFTEHDSLTTSDHPDFEDRYAEASKNIKEQYIDDNPYDFYDNFYEDWENSDDYQEAYEEALKWHLEDAAKSGGHYDNIFETSHQDDRFIPDHVAESIPEIAQIRAERKKRADEANSKSELSSLDKRSYEHSYGKDQHVHEMLRDYAEANGGSIDIGRMHKLFPAQKEQWKNIFGKQGKLSVEDIDQKIEAIPKTSYDISYGAWKGNKMQNLNHRDQIVIRLDHSNESIAPLKEDKGLFRTFQKVQNVSRQSGHPTNENTIAWARVDTTDPKNWFVDEVQSDFGKTVTRYLKANNEDDKADHVQTIAALHKDWRETLMNHIIKEAKKHGAERISTHSPESKVSHTGGSKVHTVYKDSYQKIPRKMGFKPAMADQLAITSGAKEQVFNTRNELGNKQDVKVAHINSSIEHNNYEDVYNYLANKKPELKEKALELAAHHKKMGDAHIERATVYGHEPKGRVIKTNMANDEYNVEQGEHSIGHNIKMNASHDSLLKNPPIDFSKETFHPGHVLDLKPSFKKAELILVLDLVKFEFILDNTKNEEIKKRAEHSIDLIKSKLNIENFVYPVSEKHLKRLKILKKNKYVNDWTANPNESTREKIPRKDKKSHTEDLHSLGRQTKTRKNAKTGQLEYLLHRGVAPADEYGHGERKTSWSPDPVVARTHADYEFDAVRDIMQKPNEPYNQAILEQTGFDSHPKPMVLSHWIPVGNIHRYIGNTGANPHENEVIVSPGDFERHEVENKKPSLTKQEQFAPQPLAPKSTHNEKIRQVADQYAASKGFQIQHPTEKATVNPERATKVAQAYHEMKHDPNHPAVKQSYQALIQETSDQFDHIKKTGMKFSKMKPGMASPYKSSKDLFKDMHENNHMWYFPTEQGYGSGEKVNDHPMLTPTPHKHNDGTPMLANDMFRIVHDYFGHAKEGNGFGPKGEEHAWLNHKQMYSPLAQKAMTSETRGQNSWVNFGPYGKQNRANPAQTKYADQKAGLLPDWASESNEPKKFGKSEHWKKKYDVIIKGAPQRLWPYNPVKNVTEKERDITSSWTQAGSDNAWEEKDRQNIPEMSPTVKPRALHKLRGAAKTRKNGKTGEIEYLLHRGGDKEEFKNVVQNAKHIQYDKNMSWTPHWKVAQSFANDVETNLGGEEKGKVVSAWIPESKIHHVPKMLGQLGYDYEKLGPGKFQRSGEFEVITKPHKFDLQTHEDPKDYRAYDVYDKPMNLGRRLKHKIPLSEALSNTPFQYEKPVRVSKQKNNKSKYNPFIGKSENDLQKMGKRGDWEREGYKMKISYPGKMQTEPDRNIIRITAHSKDGGVAGEYDFSHHPEYKQVVPESVATHTAHRRKGLATAAYSLAEKVTGKTVDNSGGDPSEDAKKLWNQPNRPFGESKNWKKKYNPFIGKSENDLQKMGKRGDWKKEGYSLHIEPWNHEGPEHTFDPKIHDGYMVAKDPKGKRIGYSSFYHEGPKNIRVYETAVQGDHQRKGLASSMYNLAEKLSNKKMLPYEDQTNAAKKLWAQKKRPFGKSENWKKKYDAILDLKKMPTIAEYPDYMDTDEFPTQHIKPHHIKETKKLSDNLWYHHVQQKDSDSHYLTDTKHLLGGKDDGHIVGTVFIEPPDDKGRSNVGHSFVRSDRRGEGLGSQLYKLAAQKHGKIHSDITLSADARDAYKSVSKDPNFNVDFAATDDDEGYDDLPEETRHSIEYVGKPKMNKSDTIMKAGPDFKEPKKYQFDSTFVDPADPNTVNADSHGLGGNMHTVEGQRDLVHGLNIESGTPISTPFSKKKYSSKGGMWHTNPLTGDEVIVKPATGVPVHPSLQNNQEIQRAAGHLDKRGHNSVRREVMFHNMANKFFGLGEHVPTTSGFTKRGQDFSAQKRVDAHSVHSSDYPNQTIPPTVKKKIDDTLKSHHKDGTLHKLAIMDSIMANHDRNKGNYMVGKRDGKLYLIDNGLSGDYQNSIGMGKEGNISSSDFLLQAEEKGISNKIHPEAAEWLKNLNSEDAVKMWGDHGYEPDHLAVQGFITRLKQMQYAVKTGGSDKLSEVIERVNSGKVLPPTKQISQKDATAKTQSLTQVLPKPPPIQGVIDRPEKNIPPNPEGMKKLQEAERAQSAARRAEIQAKRKKIAPIEKGALKTGLATLAAAATIASGPSAEARPVKDFAAESPKQEIVAQKPQDANKQRILDAISSTESAGGRNTKHERLPASGIHRGESAYGAYGLTPLLIRETAKMNPDIMKEHPDLHKLKGSRLHRYMAQNPNLEHKIASKHYDRLASHFGHDVDKIAHSWLNGITGTKKSLKQGNDIQNHWHVKKVRKAYGKR